MKAPSFSPSKYQLSAYQRLLCWPDGGGSSSLDDVNYTQTPKQPMSKLALKTPEWAAKHMVATLLWNRILCVLNNQRASPKGPRISSHRGRVPAPGYLMLVKEKARGYVVEEPTAPAPGPMCATYPTHLFRLSTRHELEGNVLGNPSCPGWSPVREQRLLWKPSVEAQQDLHTLGYFLKLNTVQYAKWDQETVSRRSATHHQGLLVKVVLSEVRQGLACCCPNSSASTFTFIFQLQVKSAGSTLPKWTRTWAGTDVGVSQRPFRPSLQNRGLFSGKWQLWIGSTCHVL